MTYTECLVDELNKIFSEEGDTDKITEAINKAKKRVISVFECKHCGETCDEWYMVKSEIWKKVMPISKGLLHLSCLEELLGRKLAVDDLSPASVNLAIRHFAKKV